MFMYNFLSQNWIKWVMVKEIILEMNDWWRERSFRRGIWTWNMTNSWAIEVKVQVSRLDIIYFSKSTNKAFFLSVHDINYTCTKHFTPYVFVKNTLLKGTKFPNCTVSISFEKESLRVSKKEMWMFRDGSLTCFLWETVKGNVYPVTQKTAL